MFKISRIVILGVLVLCCLFNTILAKAQAETPPWKENLNCNYPQKYKGLEYCTGMEGKAHVIIIDLNDSDIRLEYLIASGKDRNGNFGPCKDVNLPASWNTIGPGCYDPAKPNYYPVLSLFDAVKGLPNAAAVIDSDYGAFTPTNRGHGPEGFTIIQGTRIDGIKNGDTDNNGEKRPWLAFGFDPTRVEFNQLQTNSDKGLKPGWVYTAFGGAPWLVKDGILMTDEINSCKAAGPHSCAKSKAQTAVGISKDKRWLYFVMIVDTINKNIDAMTTATFMKEQIVVWQAIKLDGGGSSQLYYGGLPDKQKFISTDNSRLLSQYLGIVAQPGTGIDLESSPAPSDSNANWWQKIQKAWNDFWKGIGDRIETWWQEQKDKLSEWWENLKNDIAKRIYAWWQDLQKKIAEWFANEFEKWVNNLINQLCGTTGLIPITLASVVYSRRSKQRG